MRSEAAVENLLASTSGPVARCGRRCGPVDEELDTCSALWRSSAMSRSAANTLRIRRHARPDRHRTRENTRHPHRPALPSEFARPISP